jgi:hypothetical protein
MISHRTIPVDLRARGWAESHLRSLHYFVRIAELGSITRASAHLQIAQSSMRLYSPVPTAA